MARLVPLIGFGLFVGPAKAQITFLFTVNTTSDTVVANACDNGSAGCSLRGAIQAANAAGASTIVCAIPASDPFCSGGVCAINLTQALPDITVNTEIDGPGADKLTVRPGTGVGVRNFNVTATGVVTFFGLTISNGTGTSNGGGIFNASGILNVTNCIISGNSSSAIGGGISNSGTLNVTTSTISGNSTGLDGGGIYNGGGTVNVINSTISGNTGSAGGGIFNESTLKVTNSTISGNITSSSGGGIFNNTGRSATVKSSIIALNTATTSGPDVSGTFASAGFNLIGKRDGSLGFGVATDLLGTIASPLDPKLDPNGLQNNGGPTKTIALLFGSLAIDKGTSSGLTGNLTTDQRGSGFPRTFDDPQVSPAAGGDNTDIGAFEMQVAAPTPTPTPIATPTATPTATPVTTLANISTRLRVETGDNVLIGGFIITGTQPKKVIVRAIGPSLASFFTGVLADPIIELHGPSGFATITNDNWRSTQEAEIIATTIPPSNDLESAIVATLPANSSAYTAIVRGVNNGTGIGLVEAYDLDHTVDSKLANISTRGLVQTGDNVLIAGTIVLGSTAQNVIARAIGPSLTVPGRLGDPTLELRDANGALLRANDNWRTDQQAEIIATGIPPTNDLESAIVATLPASGASYTAIVRGVNNTTGVALVEIYAIN